MNDTILKATGDISAFGAAWASVAGWLPEVAALFTVVWTGLRIYDWIDQRRSQRRKK